MSQGITVEVVRLAMGMHELLAKNSSRNIANASMPDARAMQVDLAPLQSRLAAVVDGLMDPSQLADAQRMLANAEPVATGAFIERDLEVADMVASSLQYQALAEGLGRHFGLMRLAISGKV